MQRDMVDDTWMEVVQPQSEEETWTKTNSSNSIADDNNNDGGGNLKNDDFTVMGGDGNLPSVKSMLEGDWYMNPNHHQEELLPDLQTHTQSDIGFSSDPNSVFLMQPSAPSFTFDPSSSQTQSFLKPCFSSFFNANGGGSSNNNNNPFENGFDLGSHAGFLASNSSVLMGFSPQMGSTLELNSNAEFTQTRAVELSSGFAPMGVGEEQGFDGSGSSNALFSSKTKVLPPVGAPPTLFQKRAARSGSGGGADKVGGLMVSPPPRFTGFSVGVEELEKRRERGEEEEVEEGLNYDSDEVIEIGKMEENANNNDTDNGVIGGKQKGKKKGMPAKNLMAERRRRKKLNDRLYMLRSVVPKISKMDRASILGDAIDYLKELLQRINDLHNELDSSSAASSLPTPTNFHPGPPTPTTLPCRVKEELSPSTVPSPKNQSAKVEVMIREGRAVNIHMFCARRPGLLVSTMKAMDKLGLDIQQAVISCFNGFSLDVFRAEQCKEGQDVLPEQIKAVLLDIATFHGMM